MEATEERASGWITYAGVILLIGGLFNVAWGLGALHKNSQFVDSGIVLNNLKTWGWISIGFAIAQLVAGWQVLQRSTVGAIIGVVVAALAMVFWFASIPIIPVMGLVAALAQFLVLYALIAHAGAFD
jgi:hypothetical protein